MSERKTKFINGEHYHIYNRGNSKNMIFHDVQDYERFQKILYSCNGTKKFKFKDIIKIGKNVYDFKRGEELVDILCYVLMPNHFHLFLTPHNSNQKRTDMNLDNNVSVFMKRITTAYSRYYNQKYNRTGNLFEGKFKSEHVDNSNYFKYLFSYVHLNPIKLIQKDWKENGIEDFNKVSNFLQDYKFSSFYDYFNSPPRQARGIINKNSFFSKIEEGTDLNKEIFDWLKFKTIT